MILTIARNNKGIKHLVLIPDTIHNGLELSDHEVQLLLTMYVNTSCILRTYTADGSISISHDCNLVDIVKLYGCNLGYFDEDDEFNAELSLNIKTKVDESDQLSDMDLNTELKVTGRTDSMKSDWKEISRIDSIEFLPRAICINDCLYLY